MNTISNRIKKIISQKLEIPIQKINNSTHLINDLKIDSLDIIEIIMTLEEIFNIEIPENISEKFNTVESIIKYITNKKNK